MAKSGMEKFQCSMITFWIFCIAFYAWSYQLQKGNEGETWIGSRDKTCESFKRCWRRTWACTEAQPAETGDRRKCLHISSSTKRSWITGKMHIHVERAASTRPCHILDPFTIYVWEELV
ncbi:hypothetical protein DAI22_09g106200 [Oryza sativa Japonica Group]|nr:hypothetical protein DAI22_09g106200 [Oryza sativa Japonica Group]